MTARPDPCPRCGEADGGRYNDGGELVCWPCWKNTRESFREAELIDRLNGVSYEAGTAIGRQLRLTSIADVELEAVRWAWEGRVVLGMLNVTVGEPGLGKSTLAYDLAAKLSRGELAGDLYGEPADSLIVTYEDHISSVVRPRLEAAGADLDHIHEVGITEEDTEELLTLPGDIERIREAVQRTGARLLIVDPIVASLSGEINSHRDQDVRRVMAPLSKLAEQLDLAVDVVMHVNKSAAKQFFMRVGGSIGFTGAARSMLLVARDPEDPEGERGLRRILAHGKCNVGPLARSVRFEIEAVDVGGVSTSRLSWLGECEATTLDLLGAGDTQDEQLAIEEAREFLVAELEAGERPEIEVRNAALERGISEATFRRARKGLTNSRRRGFGSEGKWYLRLQEGSPHRRSSDEIDPGVSAYGKGPNLQAFQAPVSTMNGHRRSRFEGERLWAEDDELVQQMEAVFNAHEIGDQEWAQIEQRFDIETWVLG